MDVVLLIARLGLAAVFAVAGVAKVLDLAGSRQAVRGFGLPAALAGPVGIALPMAELLLAVSLLPRATAWWGAAGAAVLLSAFIAGIAINLARGRAPECHCFGQLHSEPVGSATLLRNGALIIVALVIVGFGWEDPGTSAVAWIGDLSANEQVIAAIVTVQTGAIAVGWWLAFNVLGQNGRLLQRMDALEATVAGAKPAAPVSEAPRGLPLDMPAPSFTLDDLGGKPVSLDDLRAAGKSVLAIFTSPGCGPCTMLLPDVARWQRDLAETFTIALIASGTAEDNRTKAADHAIERVLLDSRHLVASSYESNRTPSAVIIRPDGTIGSPLIGGMEAIRQLMAQAALTPLPAVGAPAPDFALPDLAGRTVSVAQFAGRETLLLFWNPGCGFCKRMLDDLMAWVADRPAAAPDLVLIASGSAEENRTLGIAAPILLDDGFTTGRAFGARGTPAAVLIGADGTIASKVTIGAPAIFDLLGTTSPATRATA